MPTTAELQPCDADTTIQLDSIDPYDADETLEFESSDLQARLRRMTAPIPSDTEAEPASSHIRRSATATRPRTLPMRTFAGWLQARDAAVRFWRTARVLFARAVAAAPASVRRVCQRANARRSIAVQRARAWWVQRLERRVIVRAHLSPGEVLEVDALARAWGCSASEVFRRLLASEWQRSER